MRALEDLTPKDLVSNFLKTEDIARKRALMDEMRGVIIAGGSVADELRVTISYSKEMLDLCLLTDRKDADSLSFKETVLFFLNG